jgi:hypothetical protein
MTSPLFLSPMSPPVWTCWETAPLSPATAVRPQARQLFELNQRVKLKILPFGELTPEEVGEKRYFPMSFQPFSISMCPAPSITVQHLWVSRTIPPLSIHTP